MRGTSPEAPCVGRGIGADAHEGFISPDQVACTLPPVQIDEPIGDLGCIKEAARVGQRAGGAAGLPPGRFAAATSMPNTQLAAVEAAAVASGRLGSGDGSGVASPWQEDCWTGIPSK